jgi:two-component system cell cycle sensor histidine kinase/response regulator CckA
MKSEARAVSALSNPRVFTLGVVLLAPLVILPQLLQSSAEVSGMHGHGYCYLWNPSLVALHVSADSLIALSYLSISVTLGIFVYRARQTLPFHWMFLAFGVFILACGSTHAMEIWTLWSPAFWLSANVKIVTAIASLATAVTLPFLVPTAETTLEEARLSEERRQQLDDAHASLRERQRTVEQFLQALPAAVLVVNPDGTPYYANRLAVAILGPDVMHAPLAEQSAHMFRTATDHPYPADQLPLRQALDGHTAVVDDVEIHRDGGVRTALEVGAAPILNDAGQVVQAVAIVQDVSDRKSLERAFAHAQKMQAVGLLAGGIAHDFNNSLTAVYGYADLLRQELAADDRLQAAVTEIRKAADRASGLTRHLLAFSRKQILHVEPLDINGVLHDMEPMLRQLLPENIRLEWICESGGHLVTTDRSQVEQVVLNLVINARDAMADGGRLLIETGSVMFDDDYVRAHVGATPGHHVMLAVTDTGSGMDAATQARIFEPFFTTKGAGGTGLGLSTVYGIVKQSGGNVWVYSEPNRGTTLKIYLPVSEAVPAVGRTAPTMASVSGAERILLVEDDPAIRQLSASMLRQRGYTVDEMMDGESAVAFAESTGVHIDLLVTDVVLPGLNGRRVAERVSALHAGVKVLYISGYTENAIVHTGVLDPMVDFLPKPFTPTVLLERVRLVLDLPATRD